MSLHPLPEQLTVVQWSNAVGKTYRKVLHLNSSHQAVVRSEIASRNRDISATAVSDKSHLISSETEFEFKKRERFSNEFF